MTETQAKSGTAGASTTPVDGEAAPSGTPATGRAAVGRAAVPADAPPKFTRAPGMPPPPDKPGDAAAAASGGGSPAPSGGAKTPAAVGAPAAGAAAGASTRPGVSRPGPGPGVAGEGAAATATTATATATRPGLAGAAAVGAARVSEAVRNARTTVAGGASRGPRRARLNLKRIDPWSVMKFAFAVSLVLFIVVIVATSVLYLALDAMGVFEKVNTSLGDLISAGGGSEGSSFKITAKGVIGTAALIGLVNVVLFTALATLGAFIYNVCADLVGGVELTLAERD